jgi:plasmid maintenance system antidote protein VapI
MNMQVRTLLLFHGAVLEAGRSPDFWMNLQTKFDLDASPDARECLADANVLR